MEADGITCGWDIPIGTAVYTADRRWLGMVTETNAGILVVEDGIFFRRTYVVELTDVMPLHGELHLSSIMAAVMARQTTH